MKPFMAFMASKVLLLLALSCFFCSFSQLLVEAARKIETGSHRVEGERAYKIHGNEFTVEEDDHSFEAVEKLIAEDYTPARKKTPIHN
ncbi:hypothetical protein L484_023804 [Morus notabilis]|uniref:Uncharacterized protein n=1 Tax=Morus notabilis TaxID=981085 RepID=W9RTL8_9ROSA|nr:hypothetical protein L484_023804 [Morus notabilis]